MTKRYPTSEEVRASLSDSKLEQLVSELKSYDTSPVVIASYNANEKWRPMVMMAFANLADVIIENYPEASLNGFEVTRPLTKEELQAKAIAHEQSRRYNDENE